MRKLCTVWLWIGWAGAVWAQFPLRASPPQGALLSIYDTGYALCSESRTFPMKPGEAEVEIEQVPQRINPASVSFVASKPAMSPQLLDCYVLTDEDQLGARLRCRLRSDEEGPVRMRFMYGTEGLTWQASYLLLQREGENSGRLSVRVALENQSGVDYRDARVRLVESERGAFVRTPKEVTPGREGRSLRYLYGEEEPEYERAAASPAISRSFEWPRTLSLPNDAKVYATLVEKENVQVTRFLVYDGVKLDRFERDPRNDWNYGTACRSTVDSYLEITHSELPTSEGALPRGPLVAMVLRKDDTADFLGFGLVRPAESGAVIRVPLGPARGLRGARERLSYTEVTPFKEYEESFEIRLESEASEDVEVRVVEHLYRWPKYEIIKSDTEYIQTAPQTIEFRPVLKQGGQRAIRYTVRYRW